MFLKSNYKYYEKALSFKYHFAYTFVILLFF